MEVSNDIVFNCLIDLKKKQLDPISRAKLIKSYLISNQISMRVLSKKIGIPLTTIHDWLSYNKINNKKLETMKQSGLSDTDIYNILRSSKYDKVSEISEISKLDLEVDRAIILFRPYILSQPKITPLTKHKLNELVNILNRIQVHINLKKN